MPAGYEIVRNQFKLADKTLSADYGFPKTLMIDSTATAWKIKDKNIEYIIDSKKVTCKILLLPVTR